MILGIKDTEIDVAIIHDGNLYHGCFLLRTSKIAMCRFTRDEFFFQFLPRHLSYNFRWFYPSFKLSNDAQDISNILFQHTERRENRGGKFEDIENIILSLMGHSDACRGNTLTGALLYFLIILRSFERPSETLKKFHRILRIVRKWILSAIKICQLLTVVPNSSTCRSTIKKVAFCCFRNLGV